MPEKIMDPVLGDLLKHEYDAPNFCRAVVTLAAGTNFKKGSVLGKVTASGKYVLSPATGSDGSETAAAILLYDTDATAADASATVLVRGPALINTAMLVYHSSVDQPAEIAAKVASLASLNIHPVRVA